MSEMSYEEATGGGAKPVAPTVAVPPPTEKKEIPYEQIAAGPPPQAPAPASPDYNSAILPLRRDKEGIHLAVPGALSAVGGAIKQGVKDLTTLPRRMTQAAYSNPPGSREATAAMVDPAAETATMFNPASKAGSLFAKKAVPALVDIFKKATAEYGGVNLMNLETTPTGIANLTSKMRDFLLKPKAATDKIYFDNLAPKVHSIVDQMDKMDEPLSIARIESFRQTLNLLRRNPDNIERGAATRAIDAIDEWMDKLNEKHVRVPSGTQTGNEAQIVSKLLENARGNWSIAKTVEEIENAKWRGEVQASATGTGTNLDNALRQRIKSILFSKTKSQNLTPKEKGIAEDVVKGTVPGNVMRVVSGLGPGHKISGWGPAIAAAASGDMGLALTGLGAGRLAQYGAERSTKQGIQKLIDEISKRSPLYQSSVPTVARNPTMGTAIKGGTIRDLMMELGKQRQNAP